MSDRESVMDFDLDSFKRLWQKGCEVFESATNEYVIKAGPTKDGFEPSVIPFSDASSHIAEQYKTLCAKIFLSDEENRPKTLAVMSAQPNDGKTTTAVNIAATLATSFKQKVMLIDSDLRRPKMHTFFHVDRKPGLKEILEGTQDYRKFTEEAAIGKNLYLITAGGSCESPGLALNSAGMKVLLSRLVGKFDVVIFDTPPVMRAADAQAIGSLCDYCLFVVKEGVTPKHMVEEALTSLAGTGAVPDACILTNAKRTLDYYSYWTNSSYREYYQETQPY